MINITVSQNHAHKRIDRFLRQHLPDVPLSAIYRMIRSGIVRANSKKIKLGYILKTGDIIQGNINKSEWKWPLQQDMSQQNQHLVNNKVIYNELKSYIIFEDPYILALNKPPGIVTHSGKKGADVPDLLFMCLQYLKMNSDIKHDFKPAFAHRLDKSVSGIIILAKTGRALAELNSCFRNKECEKVYLTVVHGKPKNTGTISLPIERIHGKGSVISHGQRSQKAITRFQTIKTSGNLSLLEIKTQTGRTNQIRVHLQAIGHPILGDIRYGGKKVKATDGIFLHALKLEFRHPINNRKICLKCNTPKYFHIL
ncbi:MAG: RluA family pseudouridine synthase [bacterium]